MALLSTVALARAKLGLSPADTSRDAELQVVLDGVESWILAQTGYDLVGGPHSETFRRVQEGRTLWLGKRPVSALSDVQGRELGAASWETLQADLVDGPNGKLVILGRNAAGSWPPSASAGSPWASWRARIWPLVQVTYVTSAQTVPNDLLDAAAALAAYWWLRQRTPALRLHASGSDPGAIPAHLDAAIAPHRRRPATLAT